MLGGLRIAVTRPLHQAEELVAPLRAAGAHVLVAPLIRIEPAPLEGALSYALAHVDLYDWIVFSSTNGVELFVEALRRHGRDASVLQRAAIACVGPATAAAAARHGLKTHALPDEFIGDAIAAAMTRHASVAGKRVLLPRAAGSRQVLPERLQAMGAQVDDVELYRSLFDDAGAETLRREIAEDLIDVLTFTSGSAARYFAQHVHTRGRAAVAVIGPATAEVARAHGIEVAIQADPHTVEALVAAIVTHFTA